MEIKNCQPQKSDEKMIRDELSNTESCDSYYPDFSDIFDDSYRFWDFLQSQKSKNEALGCEGKLQQKTNFWDFLGPSSKKGQHTLIESVGSAATTPNNAGIHFENEPELYSKIKNIETAVSNGTNFKSPELKSTSSDDEFWDFLSCRSPVVTFKQLIKSQDSTNNDKESGISSFASRNDESAFPSISEYMESEGCSTLNSSPSSISVKAMQLLGNENETQNFNSGQNSKMKYPDKLREIGESIDYTSYVDVLNYLRQECIVSDSEVNLSSVQNDDTFFHENSAQINIKGSERYQSSLDCLYNARDQVNGKHGQKQEQNQAASSQPQLNGSSSNQRHIYDGTTQMFLKSNPGESRTDRNSNRMNSFKLTSQQRGRIHMINKRPTKRFKRNIPKLAVTSYNTGSNSRPTLNQTRLNTVNAMNFNQPNIQTSLQSFKSANSYNTELGVKSNSISVVNTLGSNVPTVTHCTPAMTSTVNITGSNTSANSTPLYFLMPTNTETLQNPNYSHYFLVINNGNNNAQIHQPTTIQNSTIGMNTNNLKNIPLQLNQSKVNSEIGIKSDNAKQNVLIVNQPITANSSSSAFVGKSSVSNIKYQSIPQVYLPYTSLMNSAAGTNQVKVQYVSKIPNVNNTVSSSEIPTNTISNAHTAPIMNIYSTNKSSGVTEQITNLKPDLKLKTIQSKLKQPPLKAIKNISLGKDKYAIQQISTPVPICGGEELNNVQGYSNFNNLNENLLLKNKLTPGILTNSSETVVNNHSNIRGTLSAVSNNFLQENDNCQNKNFKSSVASNVLPSVCSVNKNINVQEKSQISEANPINVNVVPVSGTLGINKNVSAVNTTQMTKTNSKQNISSLNLNATSNLVSLKVGNSQNKSLATLQELFPPPISMFPVCVLPQAKSQETNQATTSRVLILQENGKEQTFTHKVKIDPIPNRGRFISKKAKEKLKKGRLKTVRELLLERRKSGSTHSSSNSKVGKEIRVLRPVLRLSTCDVCPTKASPIITNISKLNTFANRNDTEETYTRKRPNILLLSSSKIIKNTNFTDDKQDNLEKEQEPICFAESSVSKNTEDSLSTCTNSTVDKRDCRPRHYDMSQLIIGDFRVDDDIDSCGRFRSKFKVIFTKRLFYYDFPVSRCNQYSLKSTDTWEHMVRIAVPFKTVVSMSLNERIIEISINTQPDIALGRLQARAGIIPNSTMYDIAVESDCTWGCMIRNSFQHKIILRKKQAEKLKSFLCHFDDRFLNIINAGLCENGINGADELSVFDGELSPTTLKQNVTKNKKHYIRRLSQWDSSDNEDQKTADDDLVLLNQMCSCRVSCRSIRCSCVKAAKSCNSVCDCISCDNPLNILETLGMNLDFSLSDSCLFQNIYQIPKLVPFLKKEVKLTCCNTFARVQDCIPGTVLCPNVDCNVQLEFSWCKKVVCYPERNPRNHCSFCGQCCFSNGRHCMTCNRCYVATSKLPNCPTCQEKTCVANPKDMESNYYNCDSKNQDNHQKSAGRSVQKPQIIISDVYSIANAENSDESLNNESSANCDSIHLEGQVNFQDSTDSVITID